jgi:polar amino acid transport system substrate-binding protein
MLRGRVARSARFTRTGFVLGALLIFSPFVVLNLVSILGASAQETTTTVTPAPPERTVRVAVVVQEPFVIKRTNTYSGFSIDLWEEIARRNGYRTEYVEKANVQEQLDAVRTGQADVAVGDVTVTAERAATVEFTQPTLNSGLQIMVQARESSTLDGLWRALTDSTVLILLVVMAVSVLAAAVLIWLLERKTNDDFAHDARRGVAEGGWWASVTMLTVGYGDRVPRTGIGRIFSVLWMVFGVLLVAVVTASFTANLTVHRLSTQIHGPDDLRDHSVVTVQDSSAAAYLRKHGIPATLVASPNEMIAEVRSGSSEAAVFDAPVLANAVHDANGNLALAGPQFTHSYDAIAVGRAAGDLRAPINHALLVLTDDGEYDRIYRTWFSV